MPQHLVISCKENAKPLGGLGQEFVLILVPQRDRLAVVMVVGGRGTELVQAGMTEARVGFWVGEPAQLGSGLV